MDAVNDIKIVFAELRKYFELLSDYLQRNDSAKYNKINNMFDVVVPELGKDDESKYKFVHEFAVLLDTLEQIYAELDFEIPPGDITKTRAYELNELYAVTKNLYRELLEKTDISEICRALHARHAPEYFYKYPRSVELFLLSAKPAELQPAIRAVLGERDVHSPFLSYNAVPGARATSADVIIHRLQDGNVAHELPEPLKTETGLKPTDVASNLVRLPDAGEFRYEIEVKNAKARTIAENIGTLRKIRADYRPHGRPEFMQARADAALASAMNRRLANLSQEEGALPDVNFGIMAITEAITKILEKSNIDNPEIAKTYKRMLIEQMEDVELRDALLYWVEFSFNNFYKSLQTNMKRKNWSDVGAIAHQQIRAVVSESVASQLRKDDNIFQELYNKQHKLETTKTV